MWLGGDDFGLPRLSLLVIAEGSLFCYLSRHRYGGVRMGYINQKGRGGGGEDQTLKDMVNGAYTLVD